MKTNQKWSLNFENTKSLEATNSLIAFVDCQIGLVPLIKDYDQKFVKNNIIALAETAKNLGLSHTATICSHKNIPNGCLIPELQNTLFINPGSVFVRSEINPWDHKNFQKNVKILNKQNIILCGLTTDTAILSLALSIALDQSMSPNVYVISDACGCSHHFVREDAMRRMQGAGVKTLSWFAFACAIQKNWDSSGSKLTDIIKGYYPEYSNTISSYECFLEHSK